jgi:hypothetical protein
MVAVSCWEGSLWEGGVYNGIAIGDGVQVLGSFFFFFGGRVSGHIRSYWSMQTTTLVVGVL